MLYLPDLWAAPLAWQGWAGFLGHRGWAGGLVPLRDLDGGLAERAASVAGLVQAEAVPPVLVGHGAGALVAALAAAMQPVTATVMVSPLAMGSGWPARALLRWDALWPLVTGGRIAPPPAPARADWLAGVGGGVAERILASLAPESASTLLDVARARVTLRPFVRPALLVSGGSDRVSPPAATAATAARLAVQHEVVSGAGHWLLAGPRWEDAAGLVHRWLVRRLDEPLLEFYAEAMADRDDDGDG